MSLIENGNENHSQSKGNKKAPTIRPGLERISWSVCAMAELCQHRSEPYAVPPYLPVTLQLGQLGPVRNRRAEKYPYLVEKVRRVCQLRR